MASFCGGGNDCGVQIRTTRAATREQSLVKDGCLILTFTTRNGTKPGAVVARDRILRLDDRELVLHLRTVLIKGPFTLSKGEMMPNFTLEPTSRRPCVCGSAGRFAALLVSSALRLRRLRLSFPFDLACMRRARIGEVAETTASLRRGAPRPRRRRRRDLRRRPGDPAPAEFVRAALRLAREKDKRK